MLKLFVVFLGGRLEAGRMGEDHEVVAVVAKSIDDARAKARQKWKGTDLKSHVDSVMEISCVDGYRVLLEQSRENSGNGIRVDDHFVEFPQLS